MLLREIFLVRFWVAYYTQSHLVKPPPPSALRPYSFAQLTAHTGKSKFQKKPVCSTALNYLGPIFFLSFLYSLDHRCLGNSYQNKHFWLASLIAEIVVLPRVLTWNPRVIFWAFHFHCLSSRFFLPVPLFEWFWPQLKELQMQTQLALSLKPETSSRCLRGPCVAITGNHKMFPNDVPY